MIATRPRPGRRALADWALERLYDLIFSGELAPTDEITESALAARLGVSRSPVREALAQLEDDGLVRVDTLTGRRSLMPFGARDVHEVYTIRAALEGLAHRLAAERITEADLEKLDAMVDEVERRVAARSGRGPAVPVHEPRLPIHETICRASGLHHLEPYLSRLWLQTKVLLTHLDRVGLYRDDEELALVAGHYRRILDALRQRSPDEAEAALKYHLYVRRDRIVEAIQRAGGVIGSR